MHETLCLVVEMQTPGMNGLQLQSHLAVAACHICRVVEVSGAYTVLNTRPK